MKKLIEHHCLGDDGTSKRRNIPPQGVSTAKSVKAKHLGHDSLGCGQEETGHEWLQAAECRTTETVDPEQEYKKELHHFLTVEYGLSVKEMFPAARGFYGETWNIQTECGNYFLKIDYWNHHKEEYQRSLSVVQYITDSGISFVPKVIKTKEGNLYSCFGQGIAAVFAYVPGELSENWSTEQLYSRLAEIYRLNTDGITLKTETFGTELLDTFQQLRNLSVLPAAVKKAIADKESAISSYRERLKKFSMICKDDKENFHITHGDAGGNCILDGDQLYLVDWDSCLLAPIERDAWIFISDQDELEKINAVLAKNQIDYRLEQNRLCYYCYQFFFHYLNEFLKSIFDAKSERQKAEIAESLIAYLKDCWIYQRLQAADAISCTAK
ncbi:MAG: phosphotransferase [Clostridia bacterium]|nr:phosphotransferase [Clostridia bacterium]